MRSEIIVTKEIVLVLTVSELELLVRDLSSVDMLESFGLLKDFEAILRNLNTVSTANSECSEKADMLSRLQYPDMTGK